jgi:hyperosmotically inducible periplasmic protein
MKKLVFILSVGTLACESKQEEARDEAAQQEKKAIKHEKEAAEHHAEAAQAAAEAKQAETEADRAITVAVRDKIATEDDLSPTAKVVAITTYNGSVTLRGPVASDAERARVVAIARQVAGVKDVNDQMVAPKPLGP